MTTQTKVPAAMTVNEAIRRFPETVEVFNRHGIDACCGGAVAIDEAAARDGADPQVVLEEVNRVVEAAS